MFLPKQLKNKTFGEPLRFISGFFYDLGYWAPVILSWYIFFTVMPEEGLRLGTKVTMVVSIVALATGVPATIFALRTLWRRHISKWVDWLCAKMNEAKLQQQKDES